MYDNVNSINIKRYSDVNKLR